MLHFISRNQENIKMKLATMTIVRRNGPYRKDKWVIVVEGKMRNNQLLQEGGHMN